MRRFTYDAIPDQMCITSRGLPLRSLSLTAEFYNHYTMVEGMGCRLCQNSPSKRKPTN